MTTAKKHIINQDLTADDVRNMCIEHNLYTRGDSEDYGKMLDRVNEINRWSFDENNEQIIGNWNVDTYVEIAYNIAEHSEHELEGDERMEHIAYLLMQKTRRWVRTKYQGYDY